jgi:hypothetical protein
MKNGVKDFVTGHIYFRLKKMYLRLSIVVVWEVTQCVHVGGYQS